MCCKSVTLISFIIHCVDFYLNGNALIDDRRSNLILVMLCEGSVKNSI